MNLSLVVLASILLTYVKLRDLYIHLEKDWSFYNSGLINEEGSVGYIGRPLLSFKTIAVN